MRRDSELFSEARLAADELIESLLRIEIDKKQLDPLSVTGFIALSSRIGKALQGTPANLQKQAVDAALAKMSDVDWKRLTKDQLNRVADAASKQLKKFGAEKIAPSVMTILNKEGKPLMEATKASAVEKFKLGISSHFDTPLDERIGKFMTASQGLYVKDQFSNVLSWKFAQHVKNTVTSGLESGFGTDEISKTLRESSLSQFGKSDHYWDLIASSYANRARTLTQIATYQQAGIAMYLWESVLDERTTESCRFLHNKRFPVSDSLDRFAAAEQTISAGGDAEQVKSELPWVRTGRDSEGNLALFGGSGESRFMVARIDQSAVGSKDQIGSFSKGMSTDQLLASGISMPPLHGLCRSTVVADVSTPVTVSVPATFVAPAPPPVPAPVTKALQRLNKLAAPFPGGVQSPLLADSSAPYLEHFSVEQTESMFATKAKNLKPKAEDVRLTSGIVDKKNVEALIKKGADEVTKMHVRAIKYDGKFWIVDDAGADIATAQRLFGKRRISVKVIDLDKATPKKNPALVKPKAAPPPKPETPKAPPPAPAAAATEETILDQKIGAARGSNEGGFYRGRDGVERYVKFYDDAAQAHGEHLANQIYRDLGLTAPDSMVFQRANGKTGYASVLFEGGQTIAEAGLTVARAEQILEGFVGDIMTANWDAVGTGLDNVMLLRSGRIARIDNGGSFLFRARAGRKPQAALNAITEWQKFVDGSNPHYASVLRKAGYETPEDFIKSIKTQFAAVKKLQKASGGWAAYVRSRAPGLTGQDFTSVVEMLESRTKLLDDQIKIALKPKPKAPVFYAEKISDVKPKRGQKFEDLPTRSVRFHRDATTLPSGETERAFDTRWKKELDKLAPEEVRAVREFTNGRYGAIREAELRGRPDSASELITKGLKKLPAQEGTVYRGMQSIDREFIDGIVSGSGLDAKGIYRLGQGNRGATTSFTWHSGFAESWADLRTDSYGERYKVLIVAKSKSARPVKPISQHAGEKELFFLRDAEFKVTGLSRLEGTKRTLVMEIEEL